jgi:uncharacterized protein with ATP-grasp and redox domains
MDFTSEGPEEPDEEDDEEAEEEEEESDNVESKDQTNFETLNSENDNTSTLNLARKELTDADCKILGNILQTNTVRKESFHYS